MASLFLSEEKFFWELFGLLKNREEVRNFSFTNSTLKELKELTPPDTRLNSWNPDALEIYQVWQEQAKFLKQAGWEDGFRFDENKIKEKLAELGKENFFSRIFNKSLKQDIKEILESYLLEINLKEKENKSGFTHNWPPFILCQHGITLESDFELLAGLPILDKRIQAQIILVQQILEKFPGKTHAISQLSDLPGGGSLQLVNSTQTLPYVPPGLALTTTLEGGEIKLVKPGFIVELPGREPLGYPQPEVLAPAPSVFFQGDLQTVWKTLIKGKDNWKEIPPELRLLAWHLARRLKLGSTPKQQQIKLEPAQAILPPPVSNVSQSQKSNPPTITTPVPAAPPLAPKDSLPIAIQELTPEQFELKNHLNKILTMADQGGVVIKSLLPNALQCLIVAGRESSDNTSPLEKVWKALADFLTSKGITLLPAASSFQPIDSNSWKTGSDKEVRLRFHDQVPKGFFLLKRIGFTDAEETKKPVYLQSQGPYPTGLKEVITVLQGDTVGNAVINAVEKLADGAGGEYQLEQDSINLFKNLYCGLLGKELRNSNQALFKSMMEKFENYLMRKFQIKPFDPQTNKVDDNFIEITGSKNVVRGVIRKVICPGLWDTERRMRLPALVEMD